MRTQLIFGFVLFSTSLFSMPADSVNQRKWITHGALIGVSGGSLLTLQSVWYSEYNQEKFHLFNDGSNWMQMDKAGHGFTAYHITKEVSSMQRWAYNYSKPGLGVIYAMGYLTTLELMDGFSAGWGFSLFDFAANGAGAGLYLLQEKVFNKQVILPKFSYSTSNYASIRPDVLGNNFPQKLLKDYNAQTYWMSVPLHTIIPISNRLSFLCISFGYGCDAKIVGDQDYWQGYSARRQFYLSFDIDCSNLTPKHPKLNKALSHLNWIKFPFPSLEFSADKTRFHWITF